MPIENIYDLYITDQERNIILEEKFMDSQAAARIIRRYPWRNNPHSHAQFWKHNTRFSFSIHYLEFTEDFQVGFTDKASKFKLPLPYVGAKYGLFRDMNNVIESLRLFFGGEFEKLEQILDAHRPEQKGD
jgi:hypothetical protein